MQYFTAHTPTHNYNGPHHCNESCGNWEIKLACGCMIPVVAGASSPDRQEIIKICKTKMTPCTTGSVNNTADDGIKGHGVNDLCSKVIFGQTRTNDRII